MEKMKKAAMFKGTLRAGFCKLGGIIAEVKVYPKSNFY